jgi:hypothetical protein
MISILADFCITHSFIHIRLGATVQRPNDHHSGAEGSTKVVAFISDTSREAGGHPLRTLIHLPKSVLANGEHNRF